MKRSITILFAMIAAFSAYSQAYIHDGDRCFESGDYTCAVTNYDSAFKNAVGKDKQIAEIKLTRAKWCDDHIKAANQAFSKKNYVLAKDEYQNVLESNPDDELVKSQIEKCTFEIEQANAPLKLSKNIVEFIQNGGEEVINVLTHQSLYIISQVPPWCTIQRNDGYFKITCVANTTNKVRESMIVVEAKDKLAQVSIKQNGLRKATTTDLSDIWNDKYGVNPERRKRLIAAGIDPDDAQIRINKGEGKPVIEITLSVSNDKLNFLANGSESKQITVFSNAESYYVSLVPSWCNVQSYEGYFIVRCMEYFGANTRTDWFKVTAGNKETKIYVSQFAKEQISSYEPSIESNKDEQSTSKKKSSCFNCPKSKDSWGISMGYLQRNEFLNTLEGIQVGLKYEPLYKHGLAFSTGIYIEGYANPLFDEKVFETGLDYYGFYIPFNLEYRFNFSKGFNLFFYGGLGFSAIGDKHVDNFEFPTTIEYGGGVRISKLQLNVGKSLIYGNLKDVYSFWLKIEPYQKFSASLSLMF